MFEKGGEGVFKIRGTEDQKAESSLEDLEPYKNESEFKLKEAPVNPGRFNKGLDELEGFEKNSEYLDRLRAGELGKKVKKVYEQVEGMEQM